MKEASSISAVIPIFNDAETVERAINSVLAQTHPVDDIILVDDCSSDDLDGALRNLPQGSYQLLRHSVNMGAAAARNTGIKASSGRYVAFLDADDTWRTEKIAAQIAALSGSDDVVAACVTGFELHRGQKVEAEIPTPATRFLDDLVWGCKVSPGSTLMVRRDCYDVVGLYDEELRRLEDWDWLLRFSKHFATTSVQSVMADIYLGLYLRGGHVREVMEATSRIRSKHMSQVAEAGFFMRQKFLSTVSVEQAAAHFRIGQKIPAVNLVLKALLIWPFQKRVFFVQLLRSLREAIGSRFR